MCCLFLYVLQAFDLFTILIHEIHATTGNLPQDVRTKDIEDLFYKYGKIRYIDLKNRKGPPFAFVEYEDPLDAEDAIDGRDGYNFDGHRLRVEFQKGSRGGGGGGSSRGGPGAGAGRGPPTRRSEYRCIISGLPSTGSWQDLKDHMREAGNVCYADVFKDGTGVVEFTRADDMKYAIKHLDDTKFRSHEVRTHTLLATYIYVSEYLLSQKSTHDFTLLFPQIRSPYQTRCSSPTDIPTSSPRLRCRLSNLTECRIGLQFPIRMTLALLLDDDVLSFSFISPNKFI